MIKTIYAIAFLVAILGLAYHFAALKIFNVFVAKDTGSQQISGLVQYGLDPAQSLFVFRPNGVATSLPVLIFVHGGSWEEDNAADYGFIGRAFAAQGYLTLVINYRARPHHTYPAFIEDVAQGVAWANQHAQQYGGNGDQIYLVGHSAGAYNVAQAVLDQHYFINAGANPGSVKAVATLAGPFDFLPLDSPITQATFGDVADLSSTQPINFAHRNAPPFLILHGSADATVYPKNAVSLSLHLQQAGAHPKLVEYKDISHTGILLALAKPLRGYAPVLEDVLTFFKDNSK